MKKLLFTLPLLLSTQYLMAECVINPVTGEEICSGEDDNKTAVVDKPTNDIDGMVFDTKSDGSQSINFTDENQNIHMESNIKKDNSGSTTIESKDPNNPKTTKIDFAKNTKIIVDENGNIKHTINNMDVISSKYGEVELNVKLPNGKDMKLKSPIGVKVATTSDKITQKLTTDDMTAIMDIDKNGNMSFEIESKSGEKFKFQTTLDVIGTLREDGKMEQNFNLGTFASKLISTKRAEVKGSFGSGDSLMEFLLKDAEVTLNDGSVEAKRSSNGTTSTITTTEDGMSITIEDEKRANNRYTMSLRRGVSNALLNVIYADQSSLRRIDRGYASFTYSTRASISDSISRSNSFTLTPNGSSNIEEKLYFDGSSDIALKSGEADIKTDIDTTYGVKKINMQNSNAFVLDTSGNFKGSSKVGSTYTEFKSNSLGENRISIRNENSKIRFNYSPRRDLSDFKLNFINTLSRDVNSSSRVSISYSPRREISFLNTLRDSSDVIISPSYDAIFEENIYLDGTREIFLTSGDANITIDSKTEIMMPNIAYSLPSLEAENDDNYFAKDINQTLSLKKGWNLVSSPIDEDINNVFIFGDFDKLQTYTNKWTENPILIPANNGIWIKMNEATDINFTGKSYKTNLNAIPSGWSLLGVSDKLESNENYNIESVWKFDGTTLIPTTLEELNSGDGFWVKKRESDSKLNIVKGWNLLGSPIAKDINDFSIFGNYEKILTYRDEQWIEPTQLSYKEGFWLKSEIVNSIAFYGDSFDADTSSYKNGWHLGSGIISDVNSLNDIDIWTFRDLNWISKEQIGSIKSGEGFWLKK